MAKSIASIGNQLIKIGNNIGLGQGCCCDNNNNNNKPKELCFCGINPSFDIPDGVVSGYSGFEDSVNGFFLTKDAMPTNRWNNSSYWIIDNSLGGSNPYSNIINNANVVLPPERIDGYFVLGKPENIPQNIANLGFNTGTCCKLKFWRYDVGPGIRHVDENLSIVDAAPPPHPSYPSNLWYHNVVNDSVSSSVTINITHGQLLMDNALYSAGSNSVYSDIPRPYFGNDNEDFLLTQSAFGNTDYYGQPFTSYRKSIFSEEAVTTIETNQPNILPNNDNSLNIRIRLPPGKENTFAAFNVTAILNWNSIIQYQSDQVWPLFHPKYGQMTDIIAGWHHDLFATVECFDIDDYRKLGMIS